MTKDITGDTRVLPVGLHGELTSDVYTPIKITSNGSIQVTIEESSPDSSLSNNPSLVLAYTDGNLTSVTKTISETSYVKTLSYTDGALTGVSAWSEV